MKSLFDFKVPDFDGHIRRSIPAIESMYDICHGLTFALAQEGTFVVDLGCSTGKFLIDTVKRAGVQYHGIDRLDWQRDKVEQTAFHKLDIVETVRGGWLEGSSVVLSLFTLQFLPWRDRIEVIERVSEGLVSGGAFIVAEKTCLESPHLDEIVERNLLEWKRLNFEDAEILDKSASLAGAMRRMPQRTLVNEMQDVFDTVNIVWAHGAFLCAVGVKE
jgi:tRNA (cmo5U34)-methyltransferase